MKLNKDDKDNLKTTLFFLRGYKNKPELGDNNGEVAEVGIEYSNSLHGLKDADKETLQEIAGELFGSIKDYPELMRELKEKYFND